MMAVERLEEKLNIMQFVDQYQKTVDRKYQVKMHSVLCSLVLIVK